MFRLLSRDSLQGVEIRPCASDSAGADAKPTGNPDCRPAEVDNLDVLNFVPLCVLLAVQEKAEQILTEAEAQAEQIRAAATARGAADGREEAKHELAPSITAFANAAQALIVFEQHMIDRFAPQLVRLALEIAEKIVGRLVEEDSDITSVVLERARREVSDAKHLRILLHPADYSALAGTAAELIRIGSQQGRRIEVVAADDIGRGGCRLETEMGVVDATVPVQLAEIRRQLLDEGLPADSAELPAA